MDLYATVDGFGLDQVELMAGAVDQDDPVAPVFGIPGFGLVESGGDDLLGAVLDGAGEPLVGGPAAGPGPPVAGAAPGGSRTQGLVVPHRL